VTQLKIRERVWKGLEQLRDRSLTERKKAGPNDPPHPLPTFRGVPAPRKEILAEAEKEELWKSGGPNNKNEGDGFREA
jgi:hypothetical protein